MKANIKHQEFENSCIQLLDQMVTYARVESGKNGKTVYDIEISKGSFERHFTTYFSCSKACFERYFENLRCRGLIMPKAEDGFTLNPQRAKTEEHFRLTNTTRLLP
jgi:hypothetical protein